MIEALISSKTRIKLLMKFFINSNTISYLRSLEQEFNESTNGIRVELNRLEKAGMLTSFAEGNRKMFQANKTHPLFKEIHNIILKHVGIDKIITNVVNKLGNLEKVFLIGDFSKGQDNGVIDLLFIGDIDKVYLLELIDKVEKLIKRKVRFLQYTLAEIDEIDYSSYNPEPLLLWQKD